MQVEFDDPALDSLEIDPAAHSYAPAVIKGFRKVINIIRAAVDERDLYALKGLRFEKLKGDRAHQHSFRINNQWRLIVELRGTAPQKRIGVIGIEDYH